VLKGVVVYILRQFYTSLAFVISITKGRFKNDGLPCCPRGMRDSEYKLLSDSAVLPFRENGGLDFSVEEIELDRATSGSGKAYAMPAVGASAL
jgi:hypothetical protein